MDYEPNEVTQAAFEDAVSGNLEGPKDTESVISMLTSIGLELLKE